MGTLTEHRQRWAVVAAGILILTLAAWRANARDASPVGADAGHTLAGTVTIYGDVWLNASDGSCGGEGGSGDLEPAAEVVVRDAGGVIVGLGRLDPGTGSVAGEPVGAPGDQNELEADRCQTTFTVPIVGDSPYYTVKLGRSSDRPAWTYSRSELDAGGWVVWLVLWDCPAEGDQAACT